MLQRRRNPVDEDAAHHTGRRGLRPDERGGERGHPDRHRGRQDAHDRAHDQPAAQVPVCAFLRPPPPFSERVRGDQHGRGAWLERRVLVLLLVARRGGELVPRLGVTIPALAVLVVVLRLPVPSATYPSATYPSAAPSKPSA